MTTVFNSMLNNFFNVVRPVRGDDGRGGAPITFEDLPAIQGQLSPKSGSERKAADSEERVITHVFYCEFGENIQRGDYVSIGTITTSGADISADDLIVQVEGVREPRTSAEHLEVDCVEYQVETESESAS